MLLSARWGEDRIFEFCEEETVLSGTIRICSWDAMYYKGRLNVRPLGG